MIAYFDFRIQSSSTPLSSDLILGLPRGHIERPLRDMGMRVSKRGTHTEFVFSSSYLTRIMYSCASK